MIYTPIEGQHQLCNSPLKRIFGYIHRHNRLRLIRSGMEERLIHRSSNIFPVFPSHDIGQTFSTSDLVVIPF